MRFIISCSKFAIKKIAEAVDVTASFTASAIFLLFHTFFRASIACIPVALLLATIYLSREEQVIPPTFAPGISHVAHAQNMKVHDLLPHTPWAQLEPCNAHFDEKKEYETAKQCVNENVWKTEDGSDAIKQQYPPRCFVIPAHAADVSRIDKGRFNAIVVFDPFMGYGAVVGFYHPDTRTLFVVENHDAPKIYRHELQHFFLHLYEPKSSGGGHFQPIWSICEEPYYSPSEKAKLHDFIEKK
jgi:hypothetical protein